VQRLTHDLRPVVRCVISTRLASINRYFTMSKHFDRLPGADRLQRRSVRHFVGTGGWSRRRRFAGRLYECEQPGGIDAFAGGPVIDGDRRVPQGQGVMGACITVMRIRSYLCHGWAATVPP
jgi:hypothetical protein